MNTYSNSAVRDFSLKCLGCFKRTRINTLMLLSVCVLAVAATPGLALAQGSARGEIDEWLQAVRGATARFHSKAQALKAGYQRNDHCVSIPGLGGMGYHWLNPLLLDDVFDPLQPEVMLYATGSDGELKLVAIEYIVLDVGQDRPEFAGYPFDILGTPQRVPHWSLHVWLYEENPNGIFTPFNPNISCP
jgi:hypothetical protein